MSFLKYLSALMMLLTLPARLPGQESTDSARLISAVVYDEDFKPVAGSHVINLRSGQGDVSDKLGLIELYASMRDSLFFRNLVFRDTLVCVSSLLSKGYIRLAKKRYALPEAKVFEWGSGYEDFKRAVVSRPAPPTMGEQLGLPGQTPAYIPFEMNDALLKSPAMLLTRPVSYFYHKSRRAQNRRKAYWLERNKEKQAHFDQLTGPEQVSSISGLEGEPLLAFLSYLYAGMSCDYRCSDYEIISEIHELWDRYRSSQPD